MMTGKQDATGTTMVTMAGQEKTFLNSYEETALDFHCPMVYCNCATCDGLIVGCTNRLLGIPMEERGGGTLEETDDKKGCGWTKECIMTLEFCWVRSDVVLDFLWAFPPTDAASANGMTSAHVFRGYRLKNSTVLQEIPEDMYLAFPSMYSQYQSMYDDCYPCACITH
eukprot:scaffold107933_cov34-Attheya_sp.AAC.2